MFKKIRQIKAMMIAVRAYKSASFCWLVSLTGLTGCAGSDVTPVPLKVVVNGQPTVGAHPLG